MNEVWYEKVSYEDAKDLVKESLANTVSSFVTAGYWLKYIRDKKEYEKEGYSSLWEMAETEFGLKESEASRAMGMNDRYSVDGNSPIMLEKYIGYNKSQLQEMLTMTEEQLEKVTADMKIQQLRQLKKTGATPEPVNTESDSDLEEELQEEVVATSQEPVNTESNGLSEMEIIEKIEVAEEVIEEYLNFEELCDEEEEEKEEITIIDGEFRELPVEEEQDCEPDLPEDEEIPMAAVEEKELDTTRKVLEKEKELLDEYLKIDDLPEYTVKRQKIIVGALANMLCELEELEEQEVMEQPELTGLKNNEQRKDFIDGYTNWPVWIEQPLTGERYYRYEFENGTAFVVRVYFHKCFDITSSYSQKWEDRYKDDWGAEEYYIVTAGKHFKDCLTNKSQMIEFLKNLQKGER